MGEYKTENLTETPNVCIASILCLIFSSFQYINALFISIKENLILLWSLSNYFKDVLSSVQRGKCSTKISLLAKRWKFQMFCEICPSNFSKILNLTQATSRSASKRNIPMLLTHLNQSQIPISLWLTWDNTLHI